MLLEEILEDIDLIVPNSLDVGKKIRWINQVMNQVFRDYPVPVKRAIIPVIHGQDTYDLPADCVEQRIDELLLNDERINYRIIDGKIQLDVKPDGHNLSIDMLYRPRPVPITEADMEKEPDFPSDYHELLILGCAHKVAMRQQNYDAANVLQAQFEVLRQEADTKLTKKKRKSLLVTHSLF